MKTTKTMTAAEFAEALGVSPRTVSDLVARGIVERSGANFPYPEAVQKYCAHMRSLATGKGGQSASAQRGELLKVQTARAKLQFDRESGKYLLAEDMERALVSAMSYLRGALLSVPKRIPGIDRRVMGEIDREVRSALTELANARPFAGFSFRPDGDDKVRSPDPTAPLGGDDDRS